MIVNFLGNSYLIQEIRIREDNYVFHEGGVGTKWTVIINTKETALYHDKHNLKWYVYHEVDEGPKKSYVQEHIEYDDFSYLN